MSAEDDFKMKIDWNFFATSHGKGAVDGIGATVKRGIWNAIKSCQIVIKDSTECFEYAKKTIKGISFI